MRFIKIMEAIEEKFEAKLKPIISMHPDIRAEIIDTIRNCYQYSCPCTYLNTSSVRTRYIHDITTPITILAVYKDTPRDTYYAIAKFTCSNCHKTHYIFTPFTTHTSPHVTYMTTYPYVSTPTILEIHSPFTISIEAIAEITNFLHKLSPKYYSPDLSVSDNLTYLLNLYTIYSTYSVLPQLSNIQSHVLRNTTNYYGDSITDHPTFYYFLTSSAYTSSIPTHVLYTANLLFQLKSEQTIHTLVMQLLGIIPEIQKFQALIST